MERASDIRKADHPIEKYFLDRWSPRAMSGEKLSKEELMSLFEAARWAPSSGNEQPWRFVYVEQGSEHWDKFFDLLMRGNRPWNEKAGVLVVVLSKKNWEEDGSPNETHSFDTGAAWENLALQASAMGLVVHGMGGFDYDKARELVNAGEDDNVEMMISIGRPGKVEDLPEKYQGREKPSDRKPISEIVFEGKLG